MNTGDAFPLMQETLAELVQGYGLGLAWVGADLRIQRATANLAEMLHVQTGLEGTLVTGLCPELSGIEIELLELLNGKRGSIRVDVSAVQPMADGNRAVGVLLAIYPLSEPSGVHHLLLVCQQVRLGELIKLLSLEHTAGQGIEWPQSALVDGLTKVGNRRAFEQELASRTLEAVQQSSDLTVAVIDLDNFQIINQRLGSAQGDRLLQIWAQALLFAFRRNDTAYRTGDDEFAVLLPTTLPGDFDGLYQRFEQILEQVRQEGFPEANASLGLAAISEQGSDPNRTLQLAVERMRLVKRSRRTLD